MTILIVYATNSSGTYNASQKLSEALIGLGHTVTIQPAIETNPASFRDYGLVILGSCTWEKITPQEKLQGQLQEHMEQLAGKCRGQRFEQSFAVFGLGDSSYEIFCGAVDHLEALVKDLGGQLIVPSLRVDGYFFDRDQNDAAVVAWAGQINQALQK